MEEKFNIETNSMNFLNKESDTYLSDIKNRILKENISLEELHFCKQLVDFHKGALSSNSLDYDITQELKTMMKDIGFKNDDPNSISMKFIKGIEDLYTKKFKYNTDLLNEINNTIKEKELAMSKTNIQNDIDMDKYEEEIDFKSM